MDFLSNLALGFSVALTPFNLLMATCGVVLGILIGALPGVGPPSGVALLLPLTFGMDPTSGIIMLAALYAGSMYGGTITSVLINTPGESASVVTCLDGHQMALQGRAGPALGIAAIGSFIAGTFGVVLLMLVSPALARWSLAFGPPETFALMLLGLTTVTLLTGDNAVKGYISMVLGLMLAMVGFDIISGDARYAFGIPEMMDGIDFLPVAIGLFGLGEVLAGAEEAKGKVIPPGRYGLRDVMPSAKDWLRSRWAIARGAVLGFSVGVLPGAGPTIATFLSYSLEKKVSRQPQEFGHGAIEGVAGPESANNAAATGAMVPMLTLGIPGSATTAIMLGGLMMWGLRPGPLLFQKNPEFVWGLIASQYIANIMLLVLSTAFIPLFVRALRVPYGDPHADHHHLVHHRGLFAQKQRVGRRSNAGLRRARVRDEETRLLACGAHAGAGARAAGRKSAASVPHHLRQRAGHLLPAARSQPCSQLPPLRPCWCLLCAPSCPRHAAARRHTGWQADRVFRSRENRLPCSSTDG